MNTSNKPFVLPPGHEGGNAIVNRLSVETSTNKLFFDGSPIVTEPEIQQLSDGFRAAIKKSSPRAKILSGIVVTLTLVFAGIGAIATTLGVNASWCYFDVFLSPVAVAICEEKKSKTTSDNPDLDKGARTIAPQAENPVPENPIVEELETQNFAGEPPKTFFKPD